jgi:hypothetical protein
MAKRTASEVWAALEEQDVDAEMEAVLAMTPEERRSELRAAGFDLDKVHAQADALGAAPARSGRVRVLRPLRRRLMVAVPVAAALAAGVALTVGPYLGSEIVTAHRPVDDSVVRAGALRLEAGNAHEARRWQACIEKLNEARALDPAGDEAPEVQAMRRSAEEALRGAP